MEAVVDSGQKTTTTTIPARVHAQNIVLTSSSQDILLLLLGQWQDTNMSKYDVTVHVPGRSLTVKTTRPDGGVRVTVGLIRAERDTVFWGKGKPTYFLSELFGSSSSSLASLQWVSVAGHGSSCFEWSRC